MAIAAGASAAPPVATDSIEVAGNGTRGPFWISGHFLMRGSDTVSSGTDTLTRDADYAIDYNTGRILFNAPLMPDDTVSVRFVRLNWALPSRWTAGDPRATLAAGNGAADRIAVRPVSYRTAIPIPSGAGAADNLRSNSAPSRLRWQGFKSFALTTSADAGARWTQGMELSLEGELTDGLDLRASVSDRFSQTGSSAGYGTGGTRLDQLDRIFIEARSAQFFGRWGEMDLKTGTTGGQTRTATGMAVRWHGANHSAGGYYARARGRLKRRRLSLRDGDAGPYDLNSGAGAQGIVRGTVTILLDGKRLQEGPQADFIIDEARGTVTFAPRLTISRTATCIVSYERSQDTYRRHLLGAEWQSQGDGVVKHHQLQMRWEGDAPEALLFGDLSASARASLAAEPDGSVRIPSARYVGTQAGDYTRDLTENGDSIFVYVGSANGDWQVRFEYAGPGRGHYRHLTGEVYEYVGEGLGAYEPLQTLTAPDAQLTVTEALEVSLGGAGRARARFTGIVSDPNRFASGNSLFARDHTLGWEIGGAQADTAWSLDWEWDRRGAAVTDERLKAAEFARIVDRWELNRAVLDTSYDEQTVRLTLPLGHYARLTSSGGLLRGSGLHAWRSAQGLALMFGRRAGLDLSWVQRAATPSHGTQRSDRSGEYRAVAQFNPKIVHLEAGWSEKSAELHQDYLAPPVRYENSHWLSLARDGIILTQRWERSVDTLIPTARVLRETALRVPIPILRAAGGRGLSFARGVRQDSDAENQVYYRGELSAQWRILATAVVDADFQLRYGTSGSTREVYLPTRLSRGQYRLERGEYIPDPHGDYRRVLVTDYSQRRAAYDGSRRLSLRWHPRLGSWRFTIESRRESQGQFAAASFGPGVWLTSWSEPAAWQTAGSIRQSADYHVVTIHPDKQTDWRLSVSRDQRITRAASAGAGGRVDDRRRYETSVRRRFRRILFAEGRLAYESRGRDAIPSLSLAGRAQTIAAAIGATPRRGGGLNVQSLALSLEARRRIEEEEHSGQPVHLWGLRPVIRGRHGSLRFRSATDLTWVGTGTAVSSLSALLAEGRPPGFSLTEAAELRYELPRRVTLSARLTADHRDTGPDRWRLDFETVARF